MKHLIEIDDSTKIGKNFISLMQTVSLQNKGIEFINEESDTLSFDAFAKQLKRSVTKKIRHKKNK